MNIIIDVTYLVSSINTTFHIFLCKKCDIGYYIVNRDIYRRRLCYQLVFQFHCYAKFLTHAKIKYIEL